MLNPSIERLESNDLLIGRMIQVHSSYYKMNFELYVRTLVMFLVMFFTHCVEPLCQILVLYDVGNRAKLGYYNLPDSPRTRSYHLLSCGSPFWLILVAFGK